MLSEQLSVLLVAYTIEYDNEFEHHLPNKTTAFGPGGAAPAVTPSGDQVKRTWLTSKVMWANFMRYVPPDGVPLELVRDLPANLAGLQRWGFIANRRVVRAGQGDPGRALGAGNLAAAGRGDRPAVGCPVRRRPDRGTADGPGGVRPASGGWVAAVPAGGGVRRRDAVQVPRTCASWSRLGLHRLSWADMTCRGCCRRCCWRSLWSMSRCRSCRCRSARTCCG